MKCLYTEGNLYINFDNYRASSIDQKGKKKNEKINKKNDKINK